MELNREESRKDFELQHGCVTCGGALAVRVTPGVVRAVCRACRAFSAMRIVSGEDGVAFVSRPGALA